MICSRREQYEIGSGTFCIVFAFFGGCVSLFPKQEGDRGEGYAQVARFLYGLGRVRVTCRERVSEECNHARMRYV